MTSNELIEAIETFDLESEIRKSIMQVEAAQPVHADAVVMWTVAMRRNLLRILSDIRDEYQLQETMAIQYIELKAKWMSLSTRINFLTIRNGSGDPELMMRSTALSILINVVDQYIEKQDIETINEFLAHQPSSKAA